MTDPFYTSADWLAVRERVLARDGRRCSVARLLGGDCSPTLHVHHLKPRREFPEAALDLSNLLTVCASHHPTVEAVRREPGPRRLLTPRAKMAQRGRRLVRA